MPSTKETQIGNVVGFKPESRTFDVSTIVPVSDHYIGIEIEAENINVNLSALSGELSYWTVVTDGSLRNNGAEFITEKLRGKDIENALNELTAVFTEYGITPKYSDRTSVHVHADMRGLTLDSLKKVLLCYGVIEPYLFKYLGNNRDENPYCVPWYKSNSLLRTVNRILQLEPERLNEGLSPILRGSPKYAALNLGAITNKGTIEFRHHYGTHDPAKLIPWVCTILALIDNVKQYDQEYILSTINQAGIFMMAQEICPHLTLINDHVCREQSNRNIIAICNLENEPDDIRNKLHEIMHGTQHPSLKKKKSKHKYEEEVTFDTVVSPYGVPPQLRRPTRRR